MQTLDFRIDATKPSSHELTVIATFQSKDEAEVELFLPTWTPGSYLLREYARHLSQVKATAGDDQRELRCVKTNKNRFTVTTDGADSFQLSYRVYAHELTVRTAHLDDSHAYWNHACLLLWPIGQRHLSARITVDHAPDWSLTCSLQASHAESISAGYSATTLHADNLDDALDAPILIGKTQRLEWEVNGIPHAIVLDGLAGIAPPATLVEDLTKIVNQAAAVFGGSLPYDRYVFMALFTGEGYGGLEHRDSTTLLMARTSLTTPSGYREFLGLAAHELFHAWNVKRMRPVEFWNYDYEQENYTKLLWLMEGWTAYYDDLLLVRAGLTSRSEYLATMAKNIQSMSASPGRLELSLEDSSFDAWIRLYRPDENTRNSSQNYYGNGAVVAMCLDILIRRASDGKNSLDAVLSKLYETTFQQGRGYEVADVYRIIEELADADVVAKLIQLTTGPLDPQLAEILLEVGVAVTRSNSGKPFLGVGFRSGSTTIASVIKDSPAAHGELAPDDELLAIQGLRVKSSNWQTTLSAVARIDEPVEILVARRGRILGLQVTPQAGPGTVKLQFLEGLSAAQQSASTAWVGEGRLA